MDNLSSSLYKHIPIGDTGITDIELKESGEFKGDCGYHNVDTEEAIELLKKDSRILVEKLHEDASFIITGYRFTRTKKYEAETFKPVFPNFPYNINITFD